MAAIGTIRKYSGIAVGIIGLAIFAFVISDALNSNTRLFGRKKMVVGYVSGEEISYENFHNRYTEQIEKIKQQRGLESVPEATRSQLRDELWQRITDEVIYGSEYDKTGINISAEEFAYIVSGPNPHPAVQQFFVDPETQQFDRARLVHFLKNMDQYPEVQAIWLDFEKELVKEKQREKYFNLIKNSLYATRLEARDNFYAKNQFANIEYVSLPVSEIPDSAVNVEESDVKAKYHEIKEKHKVDETRSFDYVVFEVLPTADDTAHLLRQMDRFKKDYAKTKNDSLFVEVNSAEGFDTLYHNRGFFNKTIDAVYFDTEHSDSILGPFIEGNFVKIAKLIDKKEDTLYSYKARHILIKPENNDTMAAMAKAREYMNQIKNGADFAQLAMRHSEDKGSAIKGGDLGWFRDGRMVKPFMDAVKKTPKGQMTIVKSKFGAHLIQVTEDKDNVMIKVGIVSVPIQPSSETYQDVYANAVEFRGNVNSYEEFDNYIKERELNKREATEVRPEEPEIPGLDNSRSLINWAYSAKLHELSDIIQFEDKFVVGALTDITEEGYASLEKIRSIVENEVIHDKKLAMQMEKLENAQGTDLNSIATSLGRNVEKLTDASFNVPFLANIGEEKYFIGSIFGHEAGQLSEAIKGRNAAFKFKLISYSEVEEPTDFASSKKELLDNLQGMSQYEAMESLKEISDIKDLRYKYY